jgi:hypothetical protein
MGTEWKRIPRSKHNREVITDLWEKAQSEQGADAGDDFGTQRKNPPEEVTELQRMYPPKQPEPDLGFASLFSDGRKRRAIPVLRQKVASPVQTTATRQKGGRQVPTTPTPPPDVRHGHQARQQPAGPCRTRD